MHVSRWIRYRLVVCGLLLLGTRAAIAALPVIYDSGATSPLTPYLDVFDELPGDDLSDAAPIDETDRVDPSRWLPIRTPELTPGSVTARPLVLPEGVVLPRPLFLIGSDLRSQRWLETHRADLAAIGAIGMLVNAESVAELEAIAVIARGLEILPASASDIAEVLGIAHIPVLISRDGITQ